MTGARSKRRTFPALAGVLALALLAGGLSARDENWRPAAPEVETPSFPYSGGFTFARIRFEPTIWGGGPFMWGLDLKWNHDYPFAEENFSRIVDEITDIEVQTEGGNVLELTDPRLFEHPWAYLCEPGFWNPTEEELENLRSYLLKGGFLVIDDFFDIRGYPVQWENFERQMGRLLPGYELVPLTVDHPVFRSFFVLEPATDGRHQLQHGHRRFLGVVGDHLLPGRRDPEGLQARGQLPDLRDDPLSRSRTDAAPIPQAWRTR